MRHEGGESRRGTLRRGLWAGGAVALALGAAWVAWAGGGAPVVHAVGENESDLDGDGLVDALEVTIGTVACAADSDGDGFGDAEELARGSNPRDSVSVPVTAGSSIGMAAYQSGGDVHVVTVVYLHDGMLRNKRLKFGARLGNSLVQVPMSALRGGDTPQVLPARALQAKLVVLDPVLAAGMVHQRRGVSLFATLARSGGYHDAEACNLVSANGELFQFLLADVGAPLTPGTGGGPGSAGALPAPNTGGIGIGGVYRPIGPSQGNPNYIQGEICAQTTVVVGVVGAMVTQEVVAADCVSGWDTYCTPGCTATVGTTIRAVDPAALIGG